MICSEACVWSPSGMCITPNFTDSDVSLSAKYSMKKRVCLGTEHARFLCCLGKDLFCSHMASE